MLNRILFWLQSKNRHGIHSPFVYNFLDRALYQKSLQKYTAQKRLLLAITDYLPLKKVGYPPEAAGSFQWLVQERALLEEGPPPYDLYIFDRPSQKVLQTLGQKHMWHNNSVVFVGKLDRNKPDFAFWKQACRQPGVSVVLEGYSAGLIFFRKEQAQEHFKIRI
ncbi:hypothetical protein [Robiginitalea sp. IMCC43444]|uniref:hypothetical protein n=1 Tax=Robiginitalea sp. IMCC43444 TaxID=3459121 RepID=UPI004041CC04